MKTPDPRSPPLQRAPPSLRAARSSRRGRTTCARRGVRAPGCGGGGACVAKTLAGRRVHADTPAPLGRPRLPLPAPRSPAIPGLSPGLLRPASGWEGSRAPHFPAPPPCDSGGGLLICSGGAARGPGRERATQKPRGSETQARERPRDRVHGEARERVRGRERERDPDTEGRGDRTRAPRPRGSVRRRGPRTAGTQPARREGDTPGARRGREAHSGTGRKQSPAWT